MIEKIEQVTDWAWEHRARFLSSLGALGVLGFGIGYAKYPEIAEIVDDNLLDVAGEL